MSKNKAPFPNMDDLIAFLNENGGKAGKREIARAFHIKGDDKIKLKHMLKELHYDRRTEDLVSKKNKSGSRRLEFCPCEITGEDSEGNLIARPLEWEKNVPKPQILITDAGRLRPAPTQGDLVVLKLKAKGKNFFHASVLRRLSEKPDRIVGVFETGTGKNGRIVSVDKRLYQSYPVPQDFVNNAKNGDVVIAEVSNNIFGQSVRYAKVVQIIGKQQDPKSASLIALHLHGIPTEFSQAALKQAEKSKLPDIKKRSDLRDIPFVTIDGEDARDFDDAVYAEPDTDKKNKDGWHILVAIADVAYFVRPHTALDDCARERGNSVYFPDRCIPMLPEKLSSDLCSLIPGQDRPCLCAHLWIDRNGRLLHHKFVRAVIRSAARLNYHEVQKVFDNESYEINALLRTHLSDMYSAFRVLAQAREKRGALELDVVEREIHLDSQGRITDITPRERLDSHRMIEEFMILANVAAAQTLEQHDIPVMYRVHEPPSAEKVVALQNFLPTIGIKTAKKGKLSCHDFNTILNKVKNTPRSGMINELILRSQSQARYSPENLGHFGLALDRYAHFTSPIRRYADLIVHRGLISALRLGDDGLIGENGEPVVNMEETGDHISATERRAAAAERDAEERYLSTYLKDRIGERFGGTINGVNRFGLFVTVDDIGADGLIPISSLPGDYYIYDEDRHCLSGASGTNTFELGEHVLMTLVEASPVTGGLLFHVLTTSDAKRSKPHKSYKKDKKKNNKHKSKRK